MIASILVADDDQDFADILRIFLEGKGHKVLVVGDGLSAAMEAAEKKPHLIFMDIQMPGAYGTTVYEALQRDSHTAKIPVIFLSGLLDEERMKARVPPSPLTRFMKKPVDLNRLYEVALELLKAHGGFTT